MKKVTLQEIANSLGISRTTVWKVFSGHEGVSDSLRTKVIAKAQELGYAIPEDFQYPQSAEETTPFNSSGATREEVSRNTFGICVSASRRRRRSLYTFRTMMP